VLLWRKPHGPSIVIAGSLAIYWAYRALLAAEPALWPNPGILPGVAPWFAVGIATRFAAPRWKDRIDRPALVALASFALFAALDLIALGIWSAVLAVLWARREGAGRIDRAALAVADVALQSPAALYLGARSYSLYLIQTPLLMFAGALQQGLVGVEPHEKALRLALLVAPAAILAAHLMYALIERPMIALGAGRAVRTRAAAACTARAKIVARLRPGSVSSAL
jgi:peptidoglycan/LPS O-acetylase OafA/YrhL